MPILGSNSSGGSRPSAPVIGSATDGGTGTTASVAFTPSTYIGKGTITYTATSSPGGLTATGSSPITVTGLTTGTAYTFTVQGTTNYGVTSAVSSASNSVTPASPSSFESIATATGTGSSSTITFSSIPSTYKSLQLRISYLADPTYLFLRPNNDTTSANYARHAFYGSASAAGSFGVIDTNPFVTNAAGESSTTNPTVAIIDINDYASTSKYKTVRVFAGNDSNGSGSVTINSLLWMSTSAISSLVIPNFNSSNYNTGSTFSLYGVK
jgi:hypothetical protein